MDRQTDKVMFTSKYEEHSDPITVNVIRFQSGNYNYNKKTDVYRDIDGSSTVIVIKFKAKQQNGDKYGTSLTNLKSVEWTQEEINHNWIEYEKEVRIDIPNGATEITVYFQDDNNPENISLISVTGESDTEPNRSNNTLTKPNGSFAKAKKVSTSMVDTISNNDNDDGNFSRNSDESENSSSQTVTKTTTNQGLKVIPASANTPADKHWVLDDWSQDVVLTKNDAVSGQDYWQKTNIEVEESDGENLYYYFLASVKEEHVDPATVPTIDTVTVGEQEQQILVYGGEHGNNTTQALSLTNRLQKPDLPLHKVGVTYEGSNQVVEEEVMTGVTFTLKQTANGSHTNQYVKAEDGSFDASEQIATVSAENATLTFHSLEDGDYLLVEKTAHDGYVKGGDWTVSVRNGQIASVKLNGQTVEQENDGKYKLTNTKLYDLPSAGGSGTYLFTIIGVAIGTTAILLLTGDKRKVLWRKLDD